MGGQLGFMAWFIDNSLKRGHSEEGLVTFQPSVRLSKTSPFIVEQLEVWSLSPKALADKAKVNAIMADQKSVLLEHKDLLFMAQLSRPPAQDSSAAYDESDLQN